jgi:D-glycero-D-manno-heptose 1,7-bisphosphate phosphatase
MRGVVFLDRDGTINEEVGYLDDPDRLVLIPGAAEAIRLLNDAGILVIVISNQAGVGRSYFSAATVEAIHRQLAKQLAVHGARVDAIFYCPHHPSEGCECRKPKTGMLLQATRRHELDMRRAFVVGDKVSDLDAGRRVGCRTVLVLTGYGEQARETFRDSLFQPDYISSNLCDAVKWILAEESIKSLSETSA